MGDEPTDFDLELGENARLTVRFEKRKRALEQYSVVLVSKHDGRWRTVRSYDNAHGPHDMHRYNPSGEKHAAEKFHDGTASEAYNAALDSIRRAWREMIGGWKGRA